MMPPYIIISPTHGKAEMIRFMTAYLGALWFHGILAAADMRLAAASSTESNVPLSSYPILCWYLPGLPTSHRYMQGSHPGATSVEFYTRE